MRLVKSNRKLEAVLGTAPHYLEPRLHAVPLAHTERGSRREGRIFSHSHASSLSSSHTSLDSLENVGATDKPRSRSPANFPRPSKQHLRNLELSRPVVLRLRSVPVPPSDNRTAALLSPHLPSIAPVSPISPTFTINLEKLQSTSLESRRKKMAKLSRTLGENIPPELVFRSSPMSASYAEKPLKKRSLESYTAPPPFSAPTPSSSSAKAPLVISRPKTKAPRTHTRTGSKIPPPPSIAAPLPPAKEGTSIAERRRKPRPRSLSLSTGTDMLVAAAQAQTSEDVLVGKILTPTVHTETVTVRSASLDATSTSQYLSVVDEQATKDIFESRSPLPFQTVVVPDERLRPTPSSHSKCTSVSNAAQGAPSAFNRRRKEVGWSGEWNQDMGEVVKNLRNLKAR
ncbi:hypothetical protein H0H87_010610 [Tephrocybe sp. NHM501043]|nr:hypothetical protein H0H87_010610 [Tephrocybe sp. NHM501043]